MTPFRSLVRYFAPYRRTLIAGTVCLLSANVLALASPLVLRYVIDGLMAGIVRTQLLIFGALLLVVALAQAVMLFLQRRILIGVAREVEYNLRNDFYSHLQKLPPEFYENQRTGDLMARATSDLAAIRMLGGLGLIATLNAVSSIAIVLPTMIMVNWRLTALAFLPLPLLTVISRRFSRQIHERSRSVQESYGRLSSSAQEMQTGVRVARAYGREDWEISKFAQTNREYTSKNIALIHLSSAFRPILEFFVGLGFLIVFSFGGYFVITGQLTIGQFVQQTLYLGVLIAPLASFGVVLNLYERAMASMGRILAITSIKPSVIDETPAHDHSRIQGEIEFRNLTFKYKNDAEPVLKNINLRIAPGQTVALVGKVGSGKSTMTDLICRLREAPQGQLLIDGQPVENISVRKLRSAIGYVPQEAILFSETVADNIGFGIKNYSTKAVESVAEEAAIAEEIKNFPKGFDTPVGERGLTLSGGQKQRMAIARALMLDPRILILDDALAPVDADTEERILKQLRVNRKQRTTIIVAHRLSTVRHADLLVMLEDGRIVERGTHDELLHIGGQYSDLYHKQLLEAELAEH